MGGQAGSRKPGLGPPCFLDTYRERLTQEAQPDPQMASTGHTDPIITEAISNLIMVGLAFRACPRRRLRRDKRSGLHSSHHMTRAP